MKLRFLQVAEKYGLLDNPYFVVKSFDERLQEIKDKTFLTWTPVDAEKLLL
jgi:hypothetical protein